MPRTNEVLKAKKSTLIKHQILGSTYNVLLYIRVVCSSGSEWSSNHTRCGRVWLMRPIKLNWSQKRATQLRIKKATNCSLFNRRSNMTEHVFFFPFSRYSSFLAWKKVPHNFWVRRQVFTVYEQSCRMVWDGLLSEAFLGCLLGPPFNLKHSEQDCSEQLRFAYSYEIGDKRICNIFPESLKYFTDSL